MVRTSITIINNQKYWCLYDNEGNMDKKYLTNAMKVSDIIPNPNNPRIIKDAKFKQLVKSIKDFPEMLNLRPIVINEDNVVLGGNMRLKAVIEAKIKEVPVIVAKGLTPEQEKEFIIKDNVGFGEWDWDELANNWEIELLSDWGLDLPLDAFVEEEEEEVEKEKISRTLSFTYSNDEADRIEGELYAISGSLESALQILIDSKK